jgi:hypothetical protein
VTLIPTDLIVATSSLPRIRTLTTAAFAKPGREFDETPVSGKIAQDYGEIKVRMRHLKNERKPMPNSMKYKYFTTE